VGVLVSVDNQQCAEAGMRKFASVLKKQYGISKKKKGL
jgi:hypothetical protein